jgi:long-subunit acyl-CoA synthetase (AMP-forming)
VEWVVSDFACAFGAFVSVPVAITTNVRTLSKILHQTDAIVAVCDEARVSILLSAMSDGGSDGGSALGYSKLKQLLVIRHELPSSKGKLEKMKGKDQITTTTVRDLDLAIKAMTDGLGSGTEVLFL